MCFSHANSASSKESYKLSRGSGKSIDALKLTRYFAFVGWILVGVLGKG
jgi:hypothetical protein